MNAASAGAGARGGNRHRHGAQARPPAGRAGRLRGSGPDSDHHRGVRDRAQRARIRQRRPGRVPDLGRAGGAALRDHRRRSRPRHRRSRGDPRRLAAVGHRHGDRADRRPPADGRVRGRGGARLRNRGAARQDAAAARRWRRPGRGGAHRRSPRRRRPARCDRRDPAAEPGYGDPARRAAHPSGRAGPAQPGAAGHQSRRRRALCRARRTGRPSAPRRRAEVAVSIEHEPRVPHPAELDPGLVPPVAGPHRRRIDGGAGEARSSSSARPPRA